MADETGFGAPTTSPVSSPPISDIPTTLPTNAEASLLPAQPQASEDRLELLTKARAFLHQPQIQREDIISKRRFLVEKGLNDAEIEGLMREMPVQIPLVPPRSYPQPPPSNLPVLLLGLARLFSWIVGGSAALAFIYYRVLLPRVTATFIARGSLKAHHLSLIQKLNASLAALKESQAEAAAVLPKPEPHKEPSSFEACLAMDALLEQAKTQNIEISGVSEISLLRCAISDFRKGSESRNPRTEEVFQVLEGKIPWLVSDEGAPFEQHLWETLSTCPLFVSSPSPDSPVPPTDGQAILYWGYVPPEPLPPTALVQSLSALSASIPKPSPDKHSPFQHALQSMTDFTGYISSQMYAPYVAARFGPTSTMGPVEEDVRKEIRALKGLVLNRRTFLPTASTRPQ
ncbi:hypothetical protein C8F04DRAFT_1026910 [Mycena alexandri]|uniref:Peroxisome membrane anchor protein Pex14p N-terminal domain-containing protein n=1 Tax=Mycena alexandri TaxID=1745969 RepID=A0AAD6TDQ3_9AGAR|nr:hypothetical protein C8F04DRAFT_1026910 [Mycena alexandri]